MDNWHHIVEKSESVNIRDTIAAKPIEKKLVMLDALRERALALRSSHSLTRGSVPREEAPAFRKTLKEPGLE